MRVLLVDDDDLVRTAMHKAFEHLSFEVVSAADVDDAVRQIHTQTFDVLLTDLHMPTAAEGKAVLAAMHRFQPRALTIVLSGFLVMESASKLDADEILEKPMHPIKIAELIRRRVAERISAERANIEALADVLEREAAFTIQCWLSRVKSVEELSASSLSDDERIYHIPGVIQNIAARLRQTRDAAISDCPAAAAHGQLRHSQGYTAPMLVHESHILHQCLVETIHRHMRSADSVSMLPGVMLIADEVNSHLLQSIESFLKTHRLAA